MMMNHTTNYKYLENIIGMMPGNVYWKNRQGIYLGCNDNAAKLVKLASRQQIVGKKLHDFVPKAIADEVDRIDEEIMQQGEMITVEENAFDYEGNPAIYLTRKVPLKDAKDKVVGLVGISVDITVLKTTEAALRKAKEEAEAANRAKSEFMRNISHDLRTPFSGLLSLTTMLYNRETDEEKKEYLGYVVESAKTLLNLIEGVLTLSMLEVGEQGLQEVSFNLHDLMKSVVHLVKMEAEKKCLKLKLSIAKNVPQQVIGDSIRLNRVLLNLISNAIKFTSQGQVELKAKLLKKTKRKIQLQFLVKDTGIGIAEQDYAKIFGRFNRLIPASQGQYQGMGIGLYIVDRFVKEMSGKIWISSKISKGSEFFCELEFLIDN